jgi:RHS repeat-associated protein
MLGNVTALVDPSGNVVERYDYDPFGAVTVLNPDFSVRGTSSYNWNYFFQGKRYDASVSLYDSRERVYSPILMRSLQADPLGLGPDNNAYRYVGNAPTSLIDPTGSQRVILNPPAGTGRASKWPKYFYYGGMWYSWNGFQAKEIAFGNPYVPPFPIPPGQYMSTGEAITILQVFGGGSNPYRPGGPLGSYLPPGPKPFPLGRPAPPTGLGTGGNFIQDPGLRPENRGTDAPQHNFDPPEAKIPLTRPITPGDIKFPLPKPIMKISPDSIGGELETEPDLYLEWLRARCRGKPMPSPKPNPKPR